MARAIFQRLSSFNCQNHLPLEFEESSWLKKIIMYLCPKIVFTSRQQCFHELLFKLPKKTKLLYVLLTLTKCCSTITSFDLWMSKGGHNIFH